MGARANNHSLADWLSNIGEPTRLKIIRALATGSKNVTELARLLNIEIVNVSHHLQRLRQADIVSADKQGRFVIYTFRTPPEVLPGGTLRLKHVPTGTVVELPPETA